MSDTMNTKCTECGSRDLEKNEVKGEIVCNDCGTVLDEYQIDYQHPSPQVGENAHNTATRNSRLGSVIDPREARRAGQSNLVNTAQRNYAKKNVRGSDILTEIKDLTNSDDIRNAANDLIVKTCFTKNPDYAGCGELPLHQMRYMVSNEGKDATYVISVCAVASIRVLSDMNKTGFHYFWQEDAEKLDLAVNDILKATKIITERIKRICQTKIGHNPNNGILYRRRRALDAFEEKLRQWIREHNIANAKPLLDWVTERLNALDDNGEGPMSDVSPNMLLAMITICGLEEFNCKMTKKGVAGIFSLTVGGVSAKLKQNQLGKTNKLFIKTFKRDSGVA